MRPPQHFWREKTPGVGLPKLDSEVGHGIDLDPVINALSLLRGHFHERGVC
jgi:hypothetical protein